MPRFLPGLPHRLLLAIAGLVACCAVAAAQAPTPRALVTEMGNVDMFGIEAATLALQKTDSAAIKVFAHQLADEHATAASSLRRIVSRRSDIALPDRPDGRHLDLLGDLAKREGSDFDRAYVAALRDAHREAAALLARYERDGSDAELKNYAASTLPVYQKLERAAQALPAP